MRQLILWTALPNGITTVPHRPGRHLSLAVRVSPRLFPPSGTGTLNDFDDFRTWAEKPWRFSVRLGNLPTITGIVPENTPNARLWESFFLAPKAIAVESRKTGDYTKRFIRSFPAARIHEFLRRRYTATALAYPTELPPIAWLQGDGRIRNPDGFAGIDPTGEDRALAQKILQANSTGHHVSPAYRQSPVADAVDFLQAEHFHDSRRRAYTTAVPVPEFDFHRAVAVLGNYDPLLRRLGLVFELLIPLPAGLPDNTPFSVRARPEAGLLADDPTDSYLAPATLCRVVSGQDRFEAVPGPQAPLKDGLIDLSSPSFSLSQVDLDGAALKLPNFARNLRTRGDGSHRFGGETDSGLPTLRTSGLSVLHDDRASDFLARINAGADFDTILAKPENHAPLAQLDQPAPLTFRAEDLVRGFRVDIRDVRKDRWLSLCQRSGVYHHGLEQKELHGIPPDEGTITPVVTSSTTTPPDADLHLHEALFHWDGWSLVAPRPNTPIHKPGVNPLKHGVGLVPPTSANELHLNVTFTPVPHTLPALRFGRLYRVRARTVDLAGNSRPLGNDNDLTGATAEVPYLRYEPVPAPVIDAGPITRSGESAERLVIRSQGVASSAETSARQIVAPVASVQMAELHGCLDQAPPDGNPTWYPILAARDGKQLDGTPRAEAPYLPDPLSRATAIAGLPGADAPTVFPVTFDGQWPHAATFQLVLEDGPLGYLWDAATRRFIVRLPKAARVTLQLSSQLPDAAALAKLGLWKWICDAAPKAWADKLQVIALQGRHWMLTPSRSVTLVHAVQQPLQPPVVVAPRPTRDAGATFGTVGGILGVSAASTDKVDFEARWTEYVCAPSEPAGFRTEDHRADLPSIQIGATGVDALPLALNQEFHDTKHRRIAYRATATSRFREFFETAAAPSGLDFNNPSASADRTVPDFVLAMPSSARPAAPEVDFIVPTFGWSREDAASTTQSHRRGRGLRVYLKGEWFSSGEGELLGVVLAHGPQITPGDGLSKAEKRSISNENAPIPPEAIQPLVTRWGIDPIWVSNLTHELPTLDHFPDAVARQSGLTLAEDVMLPTEQPRWGVSVAGHEVRWDPSLQRWYSDITLDAGPSYFPFVRLALARYQPCSVSGVELSRVAGNDCVQTVSDRLLSVANSGGDPTRVRLTLSGVAPRSAYGLNCPVRVGARLEQRHESDTGPVWVPVVAAATVLAEMQVTKSATVWSGELALPAPRDSRRFRVVVEEYELLAADEGRGVSPSLFTAADPKEPRTFIESTIYAMVTVPAAKAVWPRLVYADTVEL